MENDNQNKITFKYEFREYQKRALEEIDKYISDNKIHIVAAPGAGKTILGLKLVFEFNKNTLILVPNIAIREQWKERMLNDFNNIDASMISTNLKELKRFNVVSYQALYEYSKEEMKEIIKTHNIHTVVFDEAHHLRNAWWKKLTQIFEELKEIKTISLTATPPYDDEKNFEKYINLCGEIDAQINIPELVAQKNLCPHQDFIYFNVPTKEQEQQINEYRRSSLKIINWFENNEQIIKALATHNYIVDYTNNLDDIINNYDFFLVLIKFLRKKNIPFDKYIKDITPKNPILVSDYEKLFKYLLYKNDSEFNVIQDKIKELRHSLTQIGAINHGNINLLYNKQIEKELSQNVGKLQSINDIVEHEYNCLGNNLKLSIVTDYIMDEYSDFENNNFNHLGVMPIFKNLTEKNPSINVIVLTGSTVIIPTNLVEKFMNICHEYNIKKEKITILEMGLDFKYSRVQLKNNSKIVQIITQLFEQSDVSVLVGTVSLIGEGWDAPFVNTLIMASSISSYVTSNQIRGRAIRIDKNNLSKEANIWHLVCLEKSGRYYVKGKDFEKIEKRFSAIEGLSLKENRLTANITRFNITKTNYTQNDILQINNEMKVLSSNRDLISSRWTTALKTYKPNNKIYINKERILKNRKRIFETNKKKLIAVGALNILLFGALSPTIHSFQALLGLASIILADTGILGKIIVRATYNKKALSNISNAICNALIEKNILSKDAYVDITEANGKYVVTLFNADNRNQNLFLKCVDQAISKKYDTRYLLVANSKVFNVPFLFDKNKESAEFFRQVYSKTNFVLKSQIIYSKGKVGKLEKLKILLQQKDVHKNEEQEIFDGNVDVKFLAAALGMEEL